MKAKKHGLRDIPEYMAWSRMKSRCQNPNNLKYHRYGGRGIVVCDKWVEDFLAFYTDMGPRPSSKHSLDRIDNDGNYEPGNCRWALPSVQSNNRSTTRILEYAGFVGHIKAMARHVGMTPALLKARLDLGWDVVRAVETPPHSDEKWVTFNGRTQSLSAWGRETGFGGACISERLRAGWSVQEALTRPKKPGNRQKQEIA